MLSNFDSFSIAILLIVIGAATNKYGALSENLLVTFSQSKAKSEILREIASAILLSVPFCV